jgi:hypothetical protein
VRQGRCGRDRQDPSSGGDGDSRRSPHALLLSSSSSSSRFCMPIDLCVTFALMILVIGLDLLLPRMVHYCELPDHGLLVDFQVSQPCCAFGDYYIGKRQRICGLGGCPIHVVTRFCNFQDRLLRWNMKIVRRRSIHRHPYKP